jgi:hypothetical protein
MSDAFRTEIRFLGIESSATFVRAPEGNRCVEPFIRALTESLLWIRTFDADITKSFKPSIAYPWAFWGRPTARFNMRKNYGNIAQLKVAAGLMALNHATPVSSLWEAFDDAHPHRCRCSRERS